MPFPIDAHVLTVDTNLLHKVDTSNPQNLHGMWTVFARCAQSLEQGRRLENISWRLWNRETFCCATEDKTSRAATSLPREIPQDARIPDVPQLSGSVDSVADDEAVELTSEESAMDIVRPRIRRQDSCASNRSRGRERHITSDDFEKIVTSIIKEKEPLSAPLPEIVAPSPQPAPLKESPSSLPSYERSGSTTTESPCKSSVEEEEPSQPQSSPELNSSTTVVRGFSPSKSPIPRTVADSPRSVPAALPEPASEQPLAKAVLTRKQPVFVMGGSCSSSDQDHQSPENARVVVPCQSKKNKMFKLGGSSEEDSSVKSAIASPKPNGLLGAQKKQASFSNQVSMRTIDNDAAIADDSDDYVDESAIDDDDNDDDWEDSIEDSGKSSIDDKTYFKRVDSKPNLTSRSSLITLQLAQNERSSRLGNAASQSSSAILRSDAQATQQQGSSLATSPNDSDESPLMMKRDVRPSPLKPINEVPRSSAQPITSTASHTQLQQAALSPRTTRRNMLYTEMPASLRRNLLVERNQKTSTANAFLKRRHTSHDVANLKQYPEKAHMDDDAEAANSDEHFFQKETFGGYHSKGW